MQMTFEVKDIQQALGFITKVIPSPEFIELSAGKKGAYVSASDNGFVIRERFDARVKDKGKVCLNFDVLKGMFRNRKTIAVLTDKNNLHFKAASSKSFVGSLVTRDDIEINYKEHRKGSELSKEQSAFLFDSLKFLALEEYYFKGKLSLTAHFDGKWAYCYVTSDYHLAISKKKIKTDKPFTCTMPVPNFANIIKLSCGESFSLSVEDSAVIAYGENFYVSMPLEEQSGFPLEMTLQLSKDMQEQNSQCKMISSVALAGVMENITALSDKKTAMYVETTKDGLKFNISSSHGNVSEKLKCDVSKKDLEADIFPAMLNNFVKVMPKADYDLHIGQRQFCFSTVVDKTLYQYIGALHSD